MKLVHVATILLVLGACSKKEEQNASSGGGVGNIDLVLRSTDISPLRMFAGSGCNVSTDAGGNESGLCYTPIEVKGIFNQANLGSTTGGAPVRLLGGGTATGLSEVFKKAAFDLKTSPALDGDDNIQDGGGTYNIVTLRVQALELAFLGTSAAKVYRVRIPFTTTPPSANTTFSTCGLGGGITDADTLGTLYSGVTAFAGDILVCVKASTSELCADTDFQWVDGAGALSSSRPGSPKRLAGVYLATADSCSAGAQHPEVTWGSAGLDVMLTAPVSVSAVFAGGVKQYTVGSQTGSKLTVSLDVDLAQSIFVPTSAINGDLAAATENQILQNIDAILLKPIYVKNRKTNAAPGTGDMTATATLTVE